MVFNLAGAVAAVGVFGYVVRDFTTTKTIAPCSSRYPAAHALSLKGAGGQPLTPIELQAQSGLNERGVLGFASVKPGEGTDEPYVLEAALRASPTSGAPRDAAGGIFFTWNPAGVKPANSVCLSYDVWVPKGFDVASGGSLPGIYGPSGFHVRPEWQDDGSVRLRARVPALAGGTGATWDALSLRAPEGAGGSLALGRWTRIEQESVLNAPGRSDGIARLWIDGLLRIDYGQLDLRRSDERYGGAQIDIRYLGRGRAASVGEKSIVRITPLQLQWKS